MTYNWFVTCPKGLEELLLDELQALGAEDLRMTVAGVYANGPLALAYRMCLWSRLANRVLLPLARFDVESAEQLYEGVQAVAWPEHLTPRQTIAVDFVGSNDAIRHTQFGAQRVKDAVVDVIQAKYADRPDVDLRRPDIRINAHLSKDRVNISLDLSGESLHKRGYRQAMVPAPLKENLAAALLIRAGWPQMINDLADKAALVDPLCGSGTLLIEGALMAADIAPGLKRSKFGFHNWLQHDDEQWQQVHSEAISRSRVGLEKGKAGLLPEIRGYDKDTRAVRAAEDNIIDAGLDGIIRVMAKPLNAFKKPTHRQIEKGLLITNPPYGERWGEMEELRPLYQQLGELAKQECPGWRLAVFTGNEALAGELRLRADRKYKLFNGTIASQLLLFQMRDADSKTDTKAAESESEKAVILPEGATMFANRLKKNSRKLKPWLKQSGVSCYRLYDADMPEYAVAVDIYHDAIHVQEYAPPQQIGEQQANKHLSEVKQALQYLYPQSRAKLFFKERRRQKGENQYQRVSARRNSNAVFRVKEGCAELEVNLQDYLDTGLFLDHRPVRHLLAELAGGKRVLNLFCYTAVATVQMALASAESSLSVDMSNTYLEWAQRNFDLNGIGKRHRLLRADCVEWLAETAQSGDRQFDLIFLDPPTFSNSKKMTSILDIQRDHPELIANAMSLLPETGVLVFSNNFRRFQMAESVLMDYQVENVTSRTLDPDFQRNQRIHNCWLIHHRKGSNLAPQYLPDVSPNPWKSGRGRGSE
ncbi:MAG: bifunctional 23S rRNA (guanine(2069)-N(7))-methyltransferase RlmK/23S rRNA (guanine(2445)-N(2))-methyltransferase RlmL [Pseudomonadales bacterium]|nr:bifunctional 23S rRNA (guanine(2069)-N(7))-methyltransferase RlmK/23S rRNA (guanine(2445)-N(2))-methyltransferase RlmL [Pseudomonadales bacterium]